MSRSRFVRLALPLGALCLLVLAPSAAGHREATITWQMQQVSGPASATGRAEADLATQLAKDTNGQIQLHIAYSTGLGINPTQMVSAVQNRGVDVGELIGSFVGPAWPETTLPEVQGLVPYGVAIHERVAAALTPFYAKQAARYNQVYFGYCHTDPRTLISRVPLHSLADLKGLKVRTIAGPETQLTQSLGANPVTNLVSGELYGAMQTGVVDAVWAVNSFYVAQKFYEVAKYVLNVNIGGATEHFTINKNDWDALTPALQKTVRKDFAAMIHECDTNVDHDYKAATGQLQAQGVTVTNLNAADQKSIATLTPPYAGAWAATHGTDGPAMLHAVRNAIGAKGVNVTLTRGEVVPAPKGVPGSAHASLTGTLVPTDFGGTLAWTLKVGGTGSPITAIRLRVGKPGKAGGTITTLCTTKCGSGATGHVNLPATRGYRSLVYGQVYVTVETAKNPKGELRGQLVAKALK